MLPVMAVVTLDEDYAALLKVELKDDADNRYQTIRIGGFKQLAGRWVFSELFWENRKTRDSIKLFLSDFREGSEVNAPLHLFQ